MRVAIVRHYDPKYACGTGIASTSYFKYLASVERQRNADWDLKTSIALMLGAFALYMSTTDDFLSFFTKYPDQMRNAHLLLYQLRKWPFFKLLAQFHAETSVRIETLRQYNKYCLFHSDTEHFAVHEQPDEDKFAVQFPEYEENQKMFDFFHKTILPAYDSIGARVNEEIYDFNPLVTLFCESRNRELTDKEKMYLNALDPKTRAVDTDLEERMNFLEGKIGVTNYEEEEQEPDEEESVKQ